MDVLLESPGDYVVALRRDGNRRALDMTFRTDLDGAHIQEMRRAIPEGITWRTLCVAQQTATLGPPEDKNEITVTYYEER